MIVPCRSFQCVRGLVRSSAALLAAGIVFATTTGCLQVQAPPPSALASHTAAALVERDPDSGPYPVFTGDASIKGTVRCIGSASVGLILNASRAPFTEVEPEIELQVISSGSGEAPDALARGVSDLAPMSRPMKPEEIAKVERMRGCKVEFVDVAIDAIAICVNSKNPLTQLTMKDLDRVFGRERRRGGGPVLAWGDVGLHADGWPTRKVVLFGMGSNHGSYGIVQETVLQGGPFRTSVNEEPVASGVVQAIATNQGAIGYLSAFFCVNVPRVRPLLLEATDGSGFIGPTESAIRSAKYPLVRALRIYFVRDPARPNPAAMQFLRYLVSEDGQDLVGELGQLRISPEYAHATMRRLSQ